MNRGRDERERDADFLPGTDELKPKRGRVRRLRTRTIPWTYSSGEGEMSLDTWADVTLASGWIRREDVILDERNVDGRGEPYRTIREHHTSLAKLVEEFPEARDVLIGEHLKLIERAAIAIDRATMRRQTLQDDLDEVLDG